MSYAKQDADMIVSHGTHRCQEERALLFRSLVTGEMPTCEDMRSNNGRGCAPTATYFKAKKAKSKGK